MALDYSGSISSWFLVSSTCISSDNSNSSFIINRQHEKLTKVMNAAGYKEKVPEKIQKANADKLESLKKEKLSLEEAGQHMEAQISSSKQN